MILNEVFAQEFYTSHLPIGVIETNGTVNRDEPKLFVKIGIINNPDWINAISDPFNDYDGNIGIEFNGNSTQLLKKKSYALSQVCSFFRLEDNGLHYEQLLVIVPQTMKIVPFI